MEQLTFGIIPGERMRTFIKSIMFILLLTILSVGCARGMKTTRGGYRPISPAFPLDDGNFKWNHSTLLDTNAIYVSLRENPNKRVGTEISYTEKEKRMLEKLGRPIPSKETEQPDSVFAFIRFMGNGRVYFGYNFDTFPSIEEQNRFDQGFIGVYRFMGPNRLQVETFQHLNWGHYSRDEVIVRENCIMHAFSDWKELEDFEHFGCKSRYSIKKFKGKGVILYTEPDW
jgi:hypothetical protein